MKIAIGADHGGFELKQRLVQHLQSLGHQVRDVGTSSTEAVDYPVFARKVAEAVASGQVERGIMIDGAGIGSSMVANKVPGVRAGVCHDTYSAHQGVEHDDMNVLCMGERVIGIEVAREVVASFLGAAYHPEERFERRLDKVRAIEQRYLKTAPDG